jgi:hypothetical protein
MSGGPSLFAARQGPRPEAGRGGSDFARRVPNSPWRGEAEKVLEGLGASRVLKKRIEVCLNLLQRRGLDQVKLYLHAICTESGNRFQQLCALNTTCGMRTLRDQLCKLRWVLSKCQEK